jgi:hypothetical protein
MLGSRVPWSGSASSAFRFFPSNHLVRSLLLGLLQPLQLETSWQTESFAAGTEFSIEAYESMRDDAVRTPAFEEALRRRLAGTTGVSVVDVGTGPFALLAIAAAKLGAEKVRVALSARLAVVCPLHRPDPCCTSVGVSRRCMPSRRTQRWPPWRARPSPQPGSRRKWRCLRGCRRQWSCRTRCVLCIQVHANPVPPRLGAGLGVTLLTVSACAACGVCALSCLRSNQVDVLVAEVIGSVATEEGVYRTIRDAQRRFMKFPEDPRSYIPLRVQTMAAPAAYAFHYLIAAEVRMMDS